MRHDDDLVHTAYGEAAAKAMQLSETVNSQAGRLDVNYDVARGD